MLMTDHDKLKVAFVNSLLEKYGALQRNGNKAVVFCCLLNRAHFTRDRSFSTASVSRSRAHLCEILAIRLLAEWHNMLDLAAAATISWPVFAGADADVVARADEYGERTAHERVGLYWYLTLGSLLMLSTGNAMEMAIISKAKNFIKSSPCQKVIDHIWS